MNSPLFDVMKGFKSSVYFLENIMISTLIVCYEVFWIRSCFCCCCVAFFIQYIMELLSQVFRLYLILLSHSVILKRKGLKLWDCVAL